MRIAVIGAGGIGGYYGALLVRAGEDVTFVLRGDTLDAVQHAGLTVHSPDGSFAVAPVAATDDPTTVGPVDVVLHTTKANGFRSALEHALPLIGPDTLVVTVQNGVGAPDIAAEVVGVGRVVPCIVRVFTQVERPGVIEHSGGPGTLTIAKGDGAASPVLDAFRDALRRAGVTVIVPDDIWVDLWLKAMYVVPFGAAGGLTGDPIGVLRDPGVLRDALRAAASEIAEVGRARGVRLPADAVERTLAFTDTMPPAATSSLQRDLLQRRPSELDAQVGAICRLGDAYGVPTPLHDLMLRALTARDDD
jgi:2-dehydropantoate 2-reductase